MWGNGLLVVGRAYRFGGRGGFDDGKRLQKFRLWDYALPTERLERVSASDHHETIFCGLAFGLVPVGEVITLLPVGGMKRRNQFVEDNGDPRRRWFSL